MLNLLFSYPVRGGSTVLGFMMIIGILCIYAINFAFFVRATNLTCGLRRFLMGVVYAIVFRMNNNQPFYWNYNLNANNANSYCEQGTCTC
jgi:hypothetical protein